MIFDYLTIAEFVFAVGTILMIRKIVKDRNALGGYDLIGSFLTLIAMTFVQTYLWQSENFLGFGLGMTQWIFWFLASSFVGKKTFTNWWQQRKGRLEVYRQFGVKNEKEFRNLSIEGRAGFEWTPDIVRNAKEAIDRKRKESDVYKERKDK